LQPLVSSFCSAVAETVRKRGGSSFHLLKDTFDAVAISVTFDTEIEAMSRAGVFQRVRAIDEKQRFVDIVFLAEFGEKLLCKNAVCRCLKLCMEQFV
jgi:hypothetical protein